MVYKENMNQLKPTSNDKIHIHGQEMSQIECLAVLFEWVVLEARSNLTSKYNFISLKYDMQTYEQKEINGKLVCLSQ